MKGMPLPFDFEGKGVFLDQVVVQENILHSEKWKNKNYYFEPTSVLDNISSSPSPTSTSNLSSSLNGGGGGGGGCCSTDGVAAVPSQKWPPENQETTTTSSNVELHRPFLLGGTTTTTTAVGEKCGFGMEDWESVLSETGQEQSILRWIMGDVEDPSTGLNKVLQISGGAAAGGGAPPDFEFSGGFGIVDQGFGLDSNNPVGQIASSAGNFMNSVNPSSNFPHKLATNSQFLGTHKISNPQNPNFSPLSNNFPSQTVPFDVKPQVFNPQVLINQHQSFLPLPLSYTQQQEQQILMPPQPKRHNPGSLEIPISSQIPKNPFLDSGIAHPNPNQNQLQLLPPYLQQQRPLMASSKKMVVDELGPHSYQQGIIDQLYKAADLVQSGNNPVLAQGILARLNHQLSPIGKPFHRAAFYFKEALQLLVHSIVNNMNPIPQSSASFSPFSLIFKIGAYKSFSEISPFIQFANFTCNQALLEALDGFDQIHIIDFDIGYGGQWASLMQELALRSNGALLLKITAFASPSTHDQLELGLTRENLTHFANEINVAFEFEIVNLDSLSSASWSLPLPFHVSENEAIAVNLPINSFSNYQIPLPLVVRFVKSLSPKIIVSVDRGCDWTDLPFSNHVIHALQSYSNLLESLDAVNMNLEALQKIERFLLQPSIEKIVMGRYCFPEKTQHWRNLFLSSGFSPLTFSNFTESQAECVVKRTPVRGFHVEKRQSSLVLCWQRRELVSASAWRC